MSLKNAASFAYVKYMVLASLLVCAWFLYTIPDSMRYHPAITWTTTQKTTPVSAMLSLEEATEYCHARRWEPYLERDGQRKIYDLFIINTELEWLEIRLGQMHEDVDYFVILEATKTFTLVDKPLHVRENWSRFEKYHDKMILHTLNTDALDAIGDNETWVRERFSRNAMYDQVIPQLTGDRAASQGDVLLVSDVDEIPRPDALKSLRNCDFPRNVTLHTAMYYYGFQWAQREEWAHPQATFYDFERTVLPDDLRSNGAEHAAGLYNAGWHCSYCFSTVAELVTKIKSFSHYELDREEFTDKAKIVERVRNGYDLFDREGSHYDRIEDNHDVPEFLLQHRETYRHLLDRDAPNANFKDYVVPEDHGFSR